MITDETKQKARESRFRRRARRLGFVLRKSRAKVWRLDDRQGYVLLDPDTGIQQAGFYWDFDLDEVEEFLNECEEGLKVPALAVAS